MQGHGVCRGRPLQRRSNSGILDALPVCTSKHGNKRSDRPCHRRVHHFRSTRHLHSGFRVPGLETWPAHESLFLWVEHRDRHQRTSVVQASTCNLHDLYRSRIAPHCEDMLSTGADVLEPWRRASSRSRASVIRVGAWRYTVSVEPCRRARVGYSERHNDRGLVGQFKTTFRVPCFSQRSPLRRPRGPAVHERRDNIF